MARVPSKRPPADLQSLVKADPRVTTPKTAATKAAAKVTPATAGLDAAGSPAGTARPPVDAFEKANQLDRLSKLFDSTARGAAAAAEAAAAGLAHGIEAVEPDVGAGRGEGTGQRFPSPADLAAKLGEKGAVFGLPEGMRGLPDPTTPTAALQNAGPSESASGRSGPPVPGPSGAMGGADSLHKIQEPKTVGDGRATRSTLRDGTIVEERTSRQDDGSRVRQTDVFYPDGTSSQRVSRTYPDGSNRAIEVTYDAEGNPIDGHEQARLPPAEGTDNPGPDEPTESQKELGRWLFGQHNVGKHAPAGSGPRETTLVNPGDPDYEGAGLGGGPRLDPGEGIVVNPSTESASPTARAMTPEQAAHLKAQLEELVRGPGAPPGGDEGGPGGTGGG